MNRRSVPNVSFVVVDLVGFQEPAVFILKSCFLVMLGLIFDISRNLTGVLRANAESAVTGLPFKMARN